MVEYLQEKEEDEEDIDDLTDAEVAPPKCLKKTTFELNDTLFAEAELDDTDTVFLWLGVRFFFFQTFFNPPTLNLTFFHNLTKRPTLCCHTKSQPPSPC